MTVQQRPGQSQRDKGRTHPDRHSTGPDDREEHFGDEFVRIADLPVLR
jgi:hypothetical protein